MALRGLSFGLLVLAATAAFARPEHKQSLKRYYGEALPAALVACSTCHVVPAGVSESKLAEDAPPHNAFGTRLRELGEQLEAEGKPFDLISRLKVVAREDADGDNIANELELLAGRSPGNREDLPDKDALAAAVAAQHRFQQQYRWEPFVTVKRPPVPTVRNTAWVRNPIDAFIAAEHESRGLTPQPKASREVLLRRVYLDLIGLPPTREELHAFREDAASDAYEQVVERLLKDPRYGERWGRHWMDVWRYSDWAGWGQQVRDSQPHIWRWRDWIIESLNADLPYDQMIVQMLAADELMPEDQNALRATGYLVRNFKLLSREQWMQDTVDHTALAFLGLTVKCARCHDHMYDAIKQKEYYGLRAIFEPHHVRTDRVPGQLDTAKDGLPRVYDKDLTVATYFYNRGDERTPDKEHPIAPCVPAALGGKLTVEEVKLPQLAYSPEKAEFVTELMLSAAKQAIDDARGKLEAARKKGNDSESQLAELDVQLAEARQASLEATIRIERLEDTGGKDEQAAIDATTKQRQSAVLEARRSVLAGEQAVERAKTAADESAKKAEEKPDDAKLKQAAEKAKTDLAAAEKKLTEARTQLEKAEANAQLPPSTEYEKRKLQTYPATSTGRRLAFARWIANKDNPLTARVAVNHIWLRHFGQPLVETVFDFGANGRAPAMPALVDWLAAELMEKWSMKDLHRLIVTSAAYRMQSGVSEANEAIDRDNRFVWQFRSRRLEAEAVRDSLLYVSGQLDATQGGPEIDHNQGLASRRRSVYFRHAAEKQMTLLKLFDAPAVTECYQRKESIVPQQALALANSDLALVQARLLARRIARECSEPAEFVTAAFEQVLTRAPVSDELTECLAFLEQQAELLKANQAKLAGTTNDPADGAKPTADVALRVRENLVHVLLNHHEFVTVR